MKVFKKTVISLVFLFLSILPLGVSAQKSLPSPKGALWRALILPGWGQAYNHQYWKIPIVYAGIGGTIGWLVYQQRWYRLYKEAYLYAAYQNETPHPYASFKDTYEALGNLPASVLRTQRNRLRRNRDLAILSVVAAYSLSVLDAYISAHLMDFDVSEDLSIHISPSTDGLTLYARW